MDSAPRALLVSILTGVVPALNAQPDVSTVVMLLAAAYAQFCSSPTSMDRAHSAPMAIIPTAQPNA